MTPSIATAQFLKAAAELGRRQAQLRPLVAKALGREPYDYWIAGNGRGDPAIDRIHRTKCGEWQFYFHALELDIRHLDDGRGVRVDFGPGGICAFTPGAVGSFVEATQAPWEVFPELREYLATPVGYDHATCAFLADALRSDGLIDHSAPELVALMAAHAKSDPGHGHVIRAPDEMQPADENALLLCDRLVITELGQQALRSMPV
jgi:hypothetical protein